MRESEDERERERERERGRNRMRGVWRVRGRMNEERERRHRATCFVQARERIREGDGMEGGEREGGRETEREIV